MKQDVCYLVCSAKDDLPVAHFDRFSDVAIYLDISQATLARALKDRRCVGGLYVEKVLL